MTATGGVILRRELGDEKICDPYTSRCRPTNESLLELSIETKGGGERRCFVSSLENTIVGPLSVDFSIVGDTLYLLQLTVNSLLIL